MHHVNNNSTTLNAFTLVETVIAMTLIAVIFLLLMQSFNSLILGSYLIDSRTTVRNESEFVSEYFKLRIKNADPRSIECSKPNAAIPKVSWQAKGTSDQWVFFADGNAKDGYKFCMADMTTSTATCETVLTYSDVRVHDIKINCEHPSSTDAPVANVSLSYLMDSTALLGNKKPAVSDVSRFVSVSIR